MTSAAEIDTTRPFRSMPRLVELVRYVLATSADNETDWIEWKCGIDLSKAPGRFAVGKQILGFGNRDPRRATNHAGGCAFVVLGAEPGNLAGQHPMDPSRVEAAIRPYVGIDGPAWLPQTVRINGTDVLVITVEPPHWGDPIHTLRKEYRPKEGGGAKDGEVFVRRPGGTHPATSGELEMLQRRLLSRPAEGLEVLVQSVGDPIPRVDLREDAVNAWLSAERQRLLAPIEAAGNERLSRDSAIAGSHMGDDEAPGIVEEVRRSGIDVNRLQEMSAGNALLAEDRTPDEYRAEVEEYLAAAAERVKVCAFNRFPDVVNVPLALHVVNTGDRNLESVEIVVSFSGAVLTHHEEYDVEMPVPPRVWGPRPKRNLASALGSLSRPYLPDLVMPDFDPPGYTATNTGSTTIEFEPFDLRPHKKYDLDEVPLLVGAQLTGSITGSWTGTAKNRDGRGEGSITVPLADSVVSIHDILTSE